MSDGFRELIVDFGRAPQEVAAKLPRIMSKSGLQVKRRLQENYRRSPHFKQVARSVDYDVKRFGFAGLNVIQVEIGPNAHRDPSAALAGIAHFGGSNGGGGTVPDPVVPMRLEEPILVGYVEAMLRGVL